MWGSVRETYQCPCATGCFYVPFSPFSHACSSPSTLTPAFLFACVLPNKGPSPNYFFIILLYLCPNLEFLILTLIISALHSIIDVVIQTVLPLQGSAPQKVPGAPSCMCRSYISLNSPLTVCEIRLFLRVLLLRLSASHGSISVEQFFGLCPVTHGLFD